MALTICSNSICRFSLLFHRITVQYDEIFLKQIEYNGMHNMRNTKYKIKDNSFKPQA